MSSSIRSSTWSEVLNSNAVFVVITFLLAFLQSFVLQFLDVFSINASLGSFIFVADSVWAISLGWWCWACWASSRRSSWAFSWRSGWGWGSSRFWKTTLDTTVAFFLLLNWLDFNGLVSFLRKFDSNSLSIVVYIVDNIILLVRSTFDWLNNHSNWVDFKCLVSSKRHESFHFNFSLFFGDIQTLVLNGIVDTSNNLGFELEGCHFCEIFSRSIQFKRWADFIESCFRFKKSSIFAWAWWKRLPYTDSTSNHHWLD